MPREHIEPARPLERRRPVLLLPPECGAGGVDDAGGHEGRARRDQVDVLKGGGEGVAANCLQDLDHNNVPINSQIERTIGFRSLLHHPSLNDIS